MESYLDTHHCAYSGSSCFSDSWYISGTENDPKCHVRTQNFEAYITSSAYITLGMLQPEMTYNVIYNIIRSVCTEQQHDHTERMKSLQKN